MAVPTLPLRLRLALLSAAAIALVEVMLIVAIALANRASSVREFDARLLQAAHATTQRLLRTEARQETPALLETVASSRDLLYIEVRDDLGNVTTVSSPRLADHVPRTERPTTTQFSDVDLSGVEFPIDADSTVRALEIPYRDAAGDRHVLMAMARTTGGAAHLDGVRERMLTVVPLSFLAATLASWMLVRRVQAPIAALSRKAEGLAPGALDVDLEDADVESDSEVGRLQIALNDALERIRTGYDAQRVFIGNVAHELKTPIAVLLAEAQTLRRERATDDELRAFAASAEEEMRVLGRTVESFLILARAGHGGEIAEPKRVSLLDVVMEAVERADALARRHHVRLVPHFELRHDGEHPPELDGDPDLLRSVFDNLIRNAISFSPRDGAVEIRLEQDAEGVVIRVTDEGPGIPQDTIEQLFERFAQASDRRGREGSFGLGLNIASNVVKLHEGAIEARNRDEGGCEFRVWLPTAD